MSASKILIVDDERNVRLNFRVALETEGYEIAEAANGLQAIELLKASRFDLVVLDLRMPEMDGIEVLHTMRSFDLDTPTIIITAHGDVPHAVEAMKYGAIDFLQKPIKPEELRSIVAEILQRHHASFHRVPATDFDSHLRAAKRLMNLRHFDGAREHLIKALELNGQSPEAFNLAGVLFEMQEDYTRAERYYKQALRLDQTHPGAQGNMRRIFELFNFGSSQEPYHLGNT